MSVSQAVPQDIQDYAASPADGSLYNADLAPVPQARRDWTWVNMSTVWMGMVHNVVAYETAAGLMALGMNAWQALGATAIAYMFLFVAMWFNAVSGTRYGLPFCVLIRASFGPRGAQLPVVLRGFIAIFWFAVQAYAGSEAINAILGTLWTPWTALTTPFLGMALNLWVSVGLFWVLHGWIVTHGVHRIRNFELFAGPLVILVGAIATIWGLKIGHGLGPLFAEPSHLSGMKGFLVFADGVTGLIGVWSTFAVNIPDLSRFVRSERDQALGQLIGLPITAVVFTLMSVIVTSATVLAFGKPIWNPVDLLMAIHNPYILVLGGVTIIIATLSVNVAANIMPACYDLINLFPRQLNFARAGMVVLVVGLAFAPWLWFKNANSIFQVLGAIGGLLGPVTGIMLADFFLVRQRKYDVAAFYRYDGAYAASGGWNVAGLSAMAIGGLAALSGLFIPGLATLYSFSWFIGVGVGAVVYAVMSRMMYPAPG
ncbi:NCS1 family nucleobase:cation symporter-1 [Acidiphilium sp. PA]|uniref:NCS1 family nucleobase:cation symporter-1 n=1 Tax=Acidiphilium sp. PA TaxID=2871705 RepID=UPI002244B305|nr:NCS1 family nucleobase:cation symporter-1 [Acidiphilium sp. PA]MCW8307891.1 NCS1 family nucleobase:cation symporter-1 [Acidiphilium sp. PA]